MNNILAIILSFVALQVNSQPRVYLGCPPAFDMSLTRSGVTTGPCEDVSLSTVKSYSVKAGSRLKVGWDSGNRQGGFVRLSLAPFNNINQAIFNQSVLKVTCFGYDGLPGESSFGSCNHPCNARGGCQFQSQASDTERYDTTITVPYNLANGDYVIQMMAFAGNFRQAIYSCSKITVSGGNPNLNCPAAPKLNSPTCHTASSSPVQDLVALSSPGKFCYNSNGAGNIDDKISERPVNADCDPRISCDISNQVQKCLKILPKILDPQSSPHLICASPSKTATVAKPTSTVKTSKTTTLSHTTKTSHKTSVSHSTSKHSTRKTSASHSHTTHSSQKTSVSHKHTRTKRTSKHHSKSTTANPHHTKTTSKETETTDDTLPTSSITPPDDCKSVYPPIKPNTPCTVNTSKITCSGDDFAQCAYVSSNHSVWVIRPCGAGTACRISKSGYPVCDYIANKTCSN